MCHELLVAAQASGASLHLMDRPQGDEIVEAMAAAESLSWAAWYGVIDSHEVIVPILVIEDEERVSVRRDAGEILAALQGGLPGGATVGMG